jgi:hypothetical protein
MGLLQTQKIGRQRSNRKKKERKKTSSKKKQKKKLNSFSSLSFYLRVQKYTRAGKDKTNDNSDQRADFNSFSGFDNKTGTKKS